MIKSGSHFKYAIEREIERRERHFKKCSISKTRAEYWIKKKMDCDLRNEWMIEYVTLYNCPKGEETYSWVNFNDEIIELLFKLMEYPDPK